MPSRRWDQMGFTLLAKLFIFLISPPMVLLLALSERCYIFIITDCCDSLL